MKFSLSNFLLLLIAHTCLAGPWVEVASPNPSSSANFLTAVSALSDNNVWAVGTWEDSDFRLMTLAVHWDGAAWSVIPSPNPSSIFDFLGGVVALGPSNVWAVGSYVPVNLQLTLVEHWNGKKWKTVPSPSVNGAGNSSLLKAVSAVSNDDIWAVGVWLDSSGGNHTLAIHWNGVSWTIVPTPTDPVGSLAAVEAVATNDVWAVGRIGSRIFFQTLILHWDGTTWNVVPSPNVGSGSNQLTGISAVAADDIWAVGYTGSPDFDAQTLGLNWDGTTWNVVPTANSSSSDQLNGVVALSGNNLWAVGQDSIADLPLTEQWKGRSWRTVPVPPVTTEAELLAVTGTPGRTLWAVGFQSFLQQTLILKKSP